MSSFPLTYRPDEHDRFIEGVAAWLRSEPVGWLLDNAPVFPDAARRGRARALGRPAAFADPDAGFGDLIAALDGLAAWRTQGTAWDTRHKGERMAVDIAFGTGTVGEAEVRARATALGLRSPREATRGEHDVVVALGGARLAPLNRTTWLAKQLADGHISARAFVALGSNRPLHPSRELPLAPLIEYAGAEARTEIDLLAGALRARLDVRGWAGEHATGVEPDHATYWSWRHAVGALRGVAEPALEVHLVEAPTTRCDRERVDTGEALEFLAGGRRRLDGRELSVAASNARPAAQRDQRDRVWAEYGLRLARGESVVLSTSAIYAPYTQLVGVRTLGLLGCSVETVAHPLAYGRLPMPGFQSAPLYIQEVRSAFQAALDLHGALARQDGARRR